MGNLKIYVGTDGDPHEITEVLEERTSGFYLVGREPEQLGLIEVEFGDGGATRLHTVGNRRSCLEEYKRLAAKQAETSPAEV